MGTGSSIEWTDKTWNPIVGCSRVSEGCRHCYAERFVHRGLAPQHRGLTIAGDGGKGPRWTGEVRLVPERLGEPLRWKKPERVFVNSLSDLFHEGVAFETIAAIFGVMAACPHLMFQVLTKRPIRAYEFFTWLGDQAEEMLAVIGAAPPAGSALPSACVLLAPDDLLALDHQRAVFRSVPWPLPNVQLGVSVEDQRTADVRVPGLLGLPAALHFVSYEPALGPVDFTSLDVLRQGPIESMHPHDPIVRIDALRGYVRGPDEMTDARVDWVIVGGESGPGARPFDVAWARGVVEQCRAAGTKCFVKQFGAAPTDSEIGFLGMVTGLEWPTGTKASGEFGASPTRLALRNRKGADMSEWPEGLRVRELPEVPHA